MFEDYDAFLMETQCDDLMALNEVYWYLNNLDAMALDCEEEEEEGEEEET